MKTEDQFDLNDYIPFAQIGRPHGLKGAFFLKTEDRRTKWDGYKRLLIETKDGFLPTKVVKSYLSGNCLALILDGVETKEQVEALYNKKIYVHKTEIRLKKDEYLAGDLRGYVVYDASNKRVLGTVLGVISFGAQDNLQIQTASSKKEILFPFIEPFVQSIDEANKSIHVIYVPEFFEQDGTDE